jgi:hypothetical protein
MMSNNQKKMITMIIIEDLVFANFKLFLHIIRFLDCFFSQLAVFCCRILPCSFPFVHIVRRPMFVSSQKMMNEPVLSTTVCQHLYLPITASSLAF